jgi:low density lipoprotein receptor-related protein 5/6
VFLALVAPLLLSRFLGCAIAGDIFWTEVSGPPGAHSIQRSKSDGSAVQTVITGLQHPRGMAVAGDRLYWMELGAPYLRSARFDGSDVTNHVAIGDHSGAVAVDVPRGKIYWTTADGAAVNSGQKTGRVRRANLDGSNIEDLVGALVHPVGIALDRVHGKVYWTDLERNFDGLGEIQRCNLDGSNVEVVITGVDEANGLAIDVTNAKLYWPELRVKAIQRANLDGSQIENVVTGVDWPTTVGLNVGEGTVYWTNAGSGTEANSVQRANLDGTDVQTLVSGSFFPWGIAVDDDPDSDGDGIPNRFETGTGVYVSPQDTGTSATIPDTDSDGLTDGQEVYVHNSNPNLPDTDGDGFDDGFEVSTGFNPTSSTSTPDALSSIRTAAEYRFNAANGISYRIESSTDLANWQTIETDIIGTGGVVTRFYSIEGQPKRFFRSRRN